MFWFDLHQATPKSFTHLPTNKKQTNIDQTAYWYKLITCSSFFYDDGWTRLENKEKHTHQPTINESINRLSMN